MILGRALGQLIQTFGEVPPIDGYSLWIPLDVDAVPARTGVDCVPVAPLVDNRLTFVDRASGNLVAAQTNVPRIGGFNPASRRAGLLVEGNHNHYLGKTGYSPTTWIASGAAWTALPDAPLVPNNPGQRLVATRTPGTHQMQRTLTAGLGWYGPAILLKRVNWSRFEMSSIAASPTFGTQARLAINLDNGTVTRVSGPATLQYGIEPWGDDAFRIWFFGNSSGGSEALTLAFTDEAGNASFTPVDDLAVDIHHMCWSDPFPYAPSVNSGETGANFVASQQTWGPTGDLRAGVSELTVYFAFTPAWSKDRLDVGSMYVFDTSMAMAGMMFDCRKISGSYQGNAAWFFQYPRGSVAVPLEPIRSQTFAVALGCSGETGFVRVKNGSGSPVGASTVIPGYPNYHQQLSTFQASGCFKDILAYPTAHSTQDMDLMLEWLIGRAA